MPEIRVVNHAKAVLGLIFRAAGIEDVKIEARRLDANAVVKIGTYKPSPHKPVAQSASGVTFRKLNISEVYEKAEEDRNPGNYLYLVPSRVLLKDEWDRIRPVVANIPFEKGLFFNCSFRITCEDGRICETGQDITEEGRKQEPAFGYNSAPPKKTYF